MTDNNKLKKTVVVIGNRQMIEYHINQMAEKYLTLVGPPVQLEEDRWRAEFKQVKQKKNLAHK